jgi:phospholipid-binding lipoprotein MlaA
MGVSAVLVLTIALFVSPLHQEAMPVPGLAAPAAEPTTVAQPAPPPPPIVHVDPGPAPVQSAAPAEGTPGDVVVRARGNWEAPDPLSAANVESFKATMAVDKAVLGPVSMVYKKKVPGPFRRGVHNFIYNLREPVVAANYLLQHKIGKAAETIGRLAINSTIGIAGLFDMAKRRPFKLPRRSNGFANTLGFYGVKNGLFLYLPIVGPTTVRDLFGGAVDRLMLPTLLGQGVTDPKFAIPMGVLGALDHRSEFDETYKALEKAPGDPYANQRDFYLQRRQAEIDQLHGRPKGAMGDMNDPPTGPVKLKRSDGGPVELPLNGTLPPPPAPSTPGAATTPDAPK